MSDRTYSCISNKTEASSVRLIDGVSSHIAFAFYLDSTNLGISALLRSSAVTSVTC